jgi:hypothetical protein
MPTLNALMQRPKKKPDGRKTPSMIWMCPDCGKRGTVFAAIEDDGRVAGYFYECPNGHCWARPYQ